jgi:hypothetical protein
MMNSLGLIFGIVAFVYVLNCQSKIKKLEERIKNLEKH